MMHLLVLAPSCPFPPRDGVQLRLCGLLRRLPERCRVTLVCFDNVASRREETLPEPHRGLLVRLPYPARPAGWMASPAAQAARAVPSLVWKFRSTAMAAEVHARAAAVDGVLAVGLQMGPYLERVPGCVPTALDNYNVESRILSRLAETRPGPRRWFWRLEAAKMRRCERRILRRAGTVFAISEVDREGLARLAPHARLRTVPMGIDLEHFAAAAPAPAGPPRFTFVGAFDWHVNEDAAAWLVDRVWPRVRSAVPGARLFLVGKDPSPVVRALGRAPEVEVTGTVPDVRPYLWSSRALLVPLRYGSGVRTKILEGFAAGRPVVSTPVGCEGLPVRHEEHLLVAGEEAGFAAACARLAAEPETARRLTAAAGALVREQDQQATAAFRGALEHAFGWTVAPEPAMVRA